MTTTDTTHRYYWERITDGAGRWSHPAGAPGAELAALRRGIDREPGEIPQMWRYYTTLTTDGRRTPALQAEHVALTLFAVHQQSQPRPIHRDGIGFGAAMQALHDDGKFSADAVDRRFAAAVTATTLRELAVHLRGLITQLRDTRTLQPLDYTQLFYDLRDWQYPDRQASVRRRWGGQYFVRKRDTSTAESSAIPYSLEE